MVTAYVLVKANTGEADRLLQDIRAIDGIVDADIVAGDVDIIAKAVVDSPADVKEISANRIQSIRGVENTSTYVAMD